MAYYGISSNLVLYLTNKLHQGTVSSSNNVTNWVGTIWMTPILGAYVADAHLGRYWTFIVASVIYLLFYVYKAEVSDSIRVLEEELKGTGTRISNQVGDTNIDQS
ncbi:hypothetical protein FEM48_Zijuj07G0096100 [Ziziphus jujuba var. spinosa]|uniref:Uncharacterized protein n=1 Tax=Ziziphus jujuba var. spinosa TaxID=714518 RepID=A0A978V3W1_ZIZJJ|nr:hypothetical protein FEM48_Zijuj07G0096100 [Ziziphus jujuba var. spinosa]